MKYIKLICILVVIIFSSIACTSITNDPSLQVVPPKNIDILIQGTWEVAAVLHQSSANEEEWIGKTIMFSNEYAMIGDYLITDVGYQVKRVIAEEYLLYHYKAFPEGFVFSGEEIEVIMATDQGVFFCEVLKEENAELILKIYNDSFLLKKVSNEVNEELLKQLKEENFWRERVKSFPQDELLRTGVLVGLRQTTEGNESNIQAQSYRTLWIASENKKLHPVLETKDIFFPRRNGFWKMEVKEILEGNKHEDALVAYNILTKGKNQIEEVNQQLSNLGQEEKAIYRTINYISNDYVSIGEKSFRIHEGEKIVEKEGLHILVIDSLPNIKRVNILDLLGAAGIESIENGRMKVLGGKKHNSLLQRIEENENYGLERRLGHWFLKGRVGYFEDNKLIVEDYNINLIPPAELVFYDELAIPWTTVKDKIPTAIDLYTSPNKDIALVVTKNEIIVFGIEEQRLQQEPLGKIPLKKGETVVMAEWATGYYVENWEKALGNYINDSTK
ncbi:hypothetical protein [Clostridium formicaceticum]|uniref:Lipoprotein n=1 Tax=Clostridium formicaceticum TaxID=1497 RepID=A0AAC9RP16_9CLOT|nr:hypothetical protein [Clostridium formicaceticum]AOY74648.1 hypothetical protein BJL90_00955 [Clostridium formicaceticum]ARE89017.1 hypothetical protein CLFO_34230 [Clostridium formicaceticum]